VEQQLEWRPVDQVRCRNSQATWRPRLHASPRNMAARHWKLSSLRRRRSRAAAVSSSSVCSSVRSAKQSTRTSTVGETEKWLSSTGQPRRHSEGRTQPSSLQHAWFHRGMGFRRTGGHHHQRTLESLGISRVLFLGLLYPEFF
jgi:hypothetical protein